MKRIDAIIRPQNLDTVKEHLAGIGVEGFTVAQVIGSGSHGTPREVYRNVGYEVQFSPKLLLTIIANDEYVPEIVDVIVRAARTGKFGDGKIFVTSLEEVIRIRTGEIDRAAC